MVFKATRGDWHNRPFYLELYIPARTGMMLISEGNARKYGVVVPDYIVEDYPEVEAIEE